MMFVSRNSCLISKLLDNQRGLLKTEFDLQWRPGLFTESFDSICALRLRRRPQRSCPTNLRVSQTADWSPRCSSCMHLKLHRRLASYSSVLLSRTLPLHPGLAPVADSWCLLFDLSKAYLIAHNRSRPTCAMDRNLPPFRLLFQAKASQAN